MTLFSSFKQLVENTAHFSGIKWRRLLVKELFNVLIEILKDQKKLVFLEPMDNVFQVDNELVIA